MLRGGAFNNDTDNVRCAYRNRNDPDNRNDNIGFRVVASTFSQRRRRKCQAGADVAVPSRPRRKMAESVPGRAPRRQRSRANNNGPAPRASCPGAGPSSSRGTNSCHVRAALFVGKPAACLPQSSQGQTQPAGRSRFRAPAGRQPACRAGGIARPRLPARRIRELLHSRAEAAVDIRGPLPRPGRPSRPLQSPRSSVRTQLHCRFVRQSDWERNASGAEPGTAVRAPIPLCPALRPPPVLPRHRPRHPARNARPQDRRPGRAGVDPAHPRRRRACAERRIRHDLVSG